MNYDNLFHIHTKRCKHASNESDEDYVKTAIKLKAKSIYFTDHAPFPGDIFGNRMSIDELPEYISSMEFLKAKYKDKITVNYGLEIEYIPRFKDYYVFLRDKYNLPLFIGQHICVWKNKYNFEYSDKTEEYLWISESLNEALETKRFSGVFHPERLYKNVKKWSSVHDNNSQLLWNIFSQFEIPIEYNYSSNEFFREQFWKYKNTNNLLYGLDSHSSVEMEEGTYFFRNNRSI